MAIFLTAPQIYRIFQRELPEGVYPDGSPIGSFSSASLYAKSQVLEAVYSNLQRIYDNEFPQTADERIADWELKVFGDFADSSGSLADRRARIIARINKIPSISLWEILTLVAGYLPEGIFVQIVEWGCDGMDGGAWTLGVSRLGVNTALGWSPATALKSDTADFCASVVTDGWRLSASHLGSQTKLSGQNSWQVISAAQQKAYTYEIRIFSYTVSGAQLDLLNKDLTAHEPARSGRLLKQNQVLSNYGLINPVTDVNQFSGVNCITRDSGSSTGYSGMKHA